MKVIDISVTITPGMPVWPGDEQVDLHRRAKIEEGAHANVSLIAASAHTGTHVDAPFHFIADGYTVESLPMDALVGPAQVVQIPSNVEVISAEVLQDLKLEPVIERILFKTANSKLWENEDAPFNTTFVGIDESGAEWLVKRGVKLVGIDYLSIAPYKRSKPTHDVLLGANVVIVEGLDLREANAGKYTLVCLPLKLKGADGAPARAVLIEN
ncbi:Kynurenine formamidase [bioreactor metagenome]|uniref:Kynurenine formamidase n=1 Tax=bioreactor metagenome TaxID=1076179 RepID=A0A645A9F0_9ZZZZ